MASSSPLLESYHMARQSLAHGDLQRASQLCQQILEADPEYAYGHFLMALLFKTTGDLEKSRMFNDIAIQYDGKQHEFYTLAAELLYYTREFARGEQMARRALQLRPDDFNALEQLFGALREQGKVEESNRLMVRLLEIKAQQEGRQVGADVKHFKAVAEEGVSMKTAPQKFVESHFDGYAESFDKHLQKDLQYQTPQLLADVLAAQSQAQAQRFLDLGCGTGLMAAALHYAPALSVGVDLSQGMLEQARAKSLYHELHKADIVSYLNTESRRFDLIAAADVLVYIGDIAPLFKAAFGRLEQGGFMAFSIESNDTAAPYRLNESERYCHNVDYIEQAARHHGFEVVLCKACVVRMEKGKPVNGCLFILSK